jgi:CRISPR system Cascade subunit CasA
LDLRDLDPLFVEVCRRVRLVSRNSVILAMGARSKAARTDWPKAMNGITGDPWAPIERSTNKVLSVSGSGFTYRKMVEYLDPKLYSQPPLAIPDSTDANHGLVISAVALARGQGKTDGFHERHIPVPKPVVPLLARGGIDVFARLGRSRAKMVGDFTRKVLRPALFLAFQGGPDKIDFGKPTTGPEVEPWMRAFDRRIDRVFFDFLFEALEARESGNPGEEARVQLGWEREVLGNGRQTLEQCLEAAPRRAMVRHRAIARARILFEGSWRNVLTGLAAEAVQ